MKKSFNVLCCTILILAACNSGNKNNEDAKPIGLAASTENSQEMKEERNKQIAMESIQAVINGNPDEALKNADPNAVDYYDGSGPVVKGVDSIKSMLTMWRGSLNDYNAENMKAIADGNTVAVYADWKGTFKNDFMGMKVAGKTFNIKDVDLFTFNDDGKITEHRSVQSQAGLMAAIK